MDEDRPVIVVGIDFSESSERARDTAIRMAKEWGAEILLVHAIHPLGSPGLDLSHPQYDPLRNETSEITAIDPMVADAWLHRVRQQVPAELVARAGRPVDVLLDEAQRVGARAIVVGSHGNTGLRHALMGSVAEAVMSRSWIPVVLVPSHHVAARPEVDLEAEKPRWLT